MSREQADTINLLDLKPRRNLEWECREDRLVTLIVPKFRNRYLVKWFVPMLAKPNIKVKLDKFGSYVWNRCDGETTVEKIGAGMAAEFGEPMESICNRIGLFLRKLSRDKFVLMESNPPGGNPTSYL